MLNECKGQELVISFVNGESNLCIVSPPRLEQPSRLRVSLSAIPEAVLRTLIVHLLNDGSTDYTHEQLDKMWKAAHLLMICVLSNDRTVHSTTQT